MSSEQNAPEDDAPAEEAATAEVVDDAPVAKAPAKKAAAKKAPAKRAPSKSAAKKAASKPVADWLVAWLKEAETEDAEQLEEPIRAFLATRSDLLPSVRKIVEAEDDLAVRAAALKLFIEADAGTDMRYPAKALDAARG